MVAIYYDVENLGSFDFLFVVEQLVSHFGAYEEFKHYAYYDWSCSPSMKRHFMLLGADCISIRDATGRRFKNQADIKLSVDLIKNSYEKDEPYVVIVSGDNHFLTVVNSLKERGIKVYVASSNQNCGKQLQECADHYIPLLPKRPKGPENNVYLSLLKIYEDNLDKNDAHKLLISILKIFCHSYIRDLFKANGVQLSTLISLIRHYMSFNVSTFGYRTATDFARAATASTEFCVAYQGTDCKDVKLFLHDFVDKDFTIMSDLEVVNVNSKEYYHQVSKLPEEFSIHKMLTMLKKIKQDLDDLPEIIEYVDLMKNIGIIKVENNKMQIVRSNYYSNAVRSYIAAKVLEKGIQVDDSILDIFK